MPSLLDAAAGGSDPTGILSLLGPALSGGVTAPGDSGANMAALLAAGSAFANAGAPTLGPPPTTAQAVLGALGAARSAGMANEILPYVAARAQQQQEMTQQQIATQQLDYNIKQFGFDRAQQIARTMQGVDATAPASAPVSYSVGARDATPPGSGNAGSGSPDIAGLPSFQALPDATRVPAIQTAMAIGMSPDEAGQWARILMHESNGLQIDPKTNLVMKNPQSSATGVGQLLTDTYGEMANKYGIKGSVTDLLPNLQASAHYFHDLTISNGGNLRNATMGYAIGPGGAANVISGKSPMDADTADYLLKTQAPGAPGVPGSVQVAGPGAGPTPSLSAASTTTPAGGGDPIVTDPITHAQVPLSILQGARGAYATEPDPMKAGKAYTDAINDYIQKRSLIPTYSPGGSGVQISSTGETKAAPVGTETISPLTDADRTKLFPGGMDRPVLGKYTPDGRLVGLEYPQVPEPQVSVPDAQAKLPVEQGGVGPAYRSGATYQRGAWGGKITEVPVSRATGAPDVDPSTGFAPLTSSVLGQQNNLRAAAQQDPRINNFQQQLTYLGRINNLAMDPSRTSTDDLAALNTFFRFMDPGAVVKQEGQDAILETGGPGQRMQTVIAHTAGGRFLTPDTIQNVTNTLNTEAEGARAGYTVASNMYRKMATDQHINPDLVVPDPEATISNYQQEWANSRKRLSSGQGVGGQTAVPGAAPTVRAGTAPPPAVTPPANTAPAVPPANPPANTAPATTPPANTPQQIPVPSPGDLAVMSKAGLQAIINDMKVNPGKYSDAYQLAIGNELAARIKRGAN